jgi:O-antigen ligase
LSTLTEDVSKGAGKARPPSAVASGIAELLLLLTLIAAPWPFGSASDTARYLVIGFCLLGTGIWALSLSISNKGVPQLVRFVCPLSIVVGLQWLFIRGLALPSWAEASLVLLGCLSVLLFWSDRGQRRRARTRFASIVIAVCFAEAVFGAVQWSATPGELFGRATPLVTAPFGSFVNHNHFAGFVEMGAVLALGATLGMLRKEGLNAKALALGGLTLGLVITQLASGSRGGFVSMSAGLGALAVGFGLRSRAGTKRRSDLLILTVALAAAVTFSLAALPRMTLAHLSTLLNGTSSASAAYRRDTARDTLRLALSHPLFGVGLGNFADEFTAFKKGHGDLRVAHAENDGLEFLSETGLVGVLAFLGITFGVALGLADRLRTGKDPIQIGLTLGAAGACFTLLVHSLLDFNLRIPANALLFASLAGFTAAPRTETSTCGGRRTSTAVAALLWLLSGLCFSRATGAWELEGALRLTDPNLRIAALTRALAYRPYLADGFRERGLAWLELAGSATPPLGAERLQRAVRDLSAAILLRPAWAEAWSELGWAEYRYGEVAKADIALGASVRLDPTNLRVGVTRADFEARIHGPSRGIQELIRLLGANPDWPPEAAAQVAQGWSDDPALVSKLANAR